MKTTAAILVETGRPLEIVTLQLPDLSPGQVIVEIAYSGVCHTQLLEARGHRGEDAYLPHCLGHEGSGTVLEIGPGVTKVKPGQRVIMSWIKGSGLEVPGTRYEWDKGPVNAGGVTTFQQHAVVSENRLTPAPEELSYKLAALVGCAVPTGVGVVLNTVIAQRGESAVVFGAGGIGLCALAGLAAAGCDPIIAVDIAPAKLEAARELGATATIDASAEEAVEKVLSMTGGGADIAIEATGRPAVMSQALQSVHPQGGRAAVIGNAHAGDVLEIDPRQLNMGKRLLGTWGGDSNPDRDYVRFCSMILDGTLKLDPLTTSVYELSDVNSALDDLEAGLVLRPLLRTS